MAVPGRFDFVEVDDEHDYSFYSGQDWVFPVGFHEPALTLEDTQGGRGVDDLVVTEGETEATSLSANFDAFDDGLKIATEDGTGIVDGTTMAVTSATTVELSEPATATGVYVATIRAFNLSNYSGHKLHVARAAGKPKLFAVEVVATRAAVGWYILQVPAATLEVRGGMAQYDWRVNNPDGLKSFWLYGDAHIITNVTTDDV